MIKTISKNLKIIIINAGIVLFIVALNIEHNPPPGWYQQTLPVQDLIRDIYFLDSLNGWIATVSHILRTTNGGEKWEITESSGNSYYKMQFLDRNYGYRCGILGGGGASIWKTTNGGFNWSLLQNFGFGFGFDDLDFINYDTGWISSVDFDFGGIWKTTNGGSNWIKQLSPPLTPVLAIKAISILNKDTGWAINNSGTVKELYRTTNGGLNWIVQYTFNGQLNDLIFLNKNKGIVSGGVNLLTTNGGFNWMTSDDGGIKISFSNDSVGWAGNNLITIQKTVNGGINWYRQRTNANNPTPFALSPLNAWAGGNKLVHTTDGGGLLIIPLNTFYLVSPPANSTLKVSNSDTSRFQFNWSRSNYHENVFYKFKIKKAGTVTEYPFISDNDGRDSVINFRISFLDSLADLFGTTADSVICLWRVTAFNGFDSLNSNSGMNSLTLRRNLIKINEISAEVPDKFYLEQNYPNPFNPTTRISYGIPKEGFVTLKIYDVLGKEVMTLVNSNMQAGYYDAEFSGSNLASGLYFYKLESGSFKETKRMLLIK